MAADIKWVPQFEAQGAWPGRVRGFHFDCGNLLLESYCQPLSISSPASCLANAPNVVPYVCKRVRRQRKNLGLLRKARKGGSEIIGRSRAHVADILRNDQVRSK